MKWCYTAVFSAFLLILTVFVCRNYVNLQEMSGLENQILLKIEQGSKSEEIKLWKNDKNEYFAFLPSYAKTENVIIQLNNAKVFLDGEMLTDGDTLKNIEFSKTYSIQSDKSSGIYPIRFLQSANAASMYVNTQTGSMERIYFDKNNKEKATVSIYKNDGTLDYSGNQFCDSIKCRGNSTFLTDKKPFLLDLEKESDLLGMGSAAKWVLLANAYDITNLRNKIVLDFAKNTSLKWTPDCEYVDLYLNGEYNGLYLLCEKVEVGKNRLDIHLETGYLFTLEQESKVYAYDTAFFTNGGRIVKMAHPQKCSKKRLDTVKEYVDFVELLISDNDTENEELYSYIDLETWVTRYLVDEIFCNVDGDQDSSYYYFDEEISDGKIFAGPAWDYDLSMGIFFEEKIPSASVIGKRKWYCRLLDKNTFFNRAKYIYKSEMRNRLFDLTENKIQIMEDNISKSAAMNNLRWDIELKKFQEETEYLKSFLGERISFLDLYWYEGDFRNETETESAVVPVNKNLSAETLLNYLKIIVLAVFILVFAFFVYINIKTVKGGR